MLESRTGVWAGIFPEGFLNVGTAAFRFAAPIEAPHPAGTAALISRVEAAVQKLSRPAPA